MQDLIPGSHASFYVAITWFRYPWVVVAGAVVIAAVTVTHDRFRALAYLVGPPLAVLIAEELVKPLVGRTLGGALTYPSGSTTGATALATAAILATPGRWRWCTAVLAGAYALWMTVAVVALRWHFPTDALAGALLGAGVVLICDGVARSAASLVASGKGGLAAPLIVPADPPRDDPLGGRRHGGRCRRLATMATVFEGSSGSNRNRMGASSSSGSPGASTTKAGRWSRRSSACCSPRATPVSTAPVADRFIHRLNRKRIGTVRLSASRPSTESAGCWWSLAGTYPHRLVLAAVSAKWIGGGLGPVRHAHHGTAACRSAELAPIVPAGCERVAGCAPPCLQGLDRGLVP